MYAIRSYYEYAFVTAFNLILRQKEQYISDYEPIIEMLTDVSALEKETATLREQQDELYTLVKNCIDEKARRGNDPALATQHKKLIGRYDAVKARLDDIASEIASRSVKNTKIMNRITSYNVCYTKLLRQVLCFFFSS